MNMVDMGIIILMFITWVVIGHILAKIQNIISRVWELERKYNKMEESIKSIDNMLIQTDANVRYVNELVKKGLLK